MTREEQLTRELREELVDAAECIAWLLEAAPQTNDDPWIKRSRAALERARAAASDETEDGPPQGKHCDDYIHDFTAPHCLRFFLLVNRLPAMDMMLCREFGTRPKLFAAHKGARVRVVMASRMGDVGITRRLDAEDGYEARVMVADLSDFKDAP